jgi:hypothetical protein
MPREVVKDRRDCYVYRHIRLDKNEPFYIGVGTGRNYKRAKGKGNTQRSGFWNRVANKTDYEVEILMDNLTWLEACEKEKEFIKLYGRINLGTGTLVNMTDGGDGQYGHKKSPETIKKMSISIKKAMQNVVQSEEQREAVRNNLKSVYLNPEFNKKRIEGIKRSAHIVAEKLSKKIVQLTINGEFIKIWDSGHQIQRETVYGRTLVSKVCRGIHKQAYGYKWVYLKDYENQLNNI